MAVRSEVQLTEPDGALSVVAGGTVENQPPEDGLDQVSAPLLAALHEAPVWDKRVLELGLAWPGLSPDQEWAAERLRVFLLTWDPFEWLPDRRAAFATSTLRADGPGLVLYLTHWQAMGLAGGQVAALADVLGRLCASVLAVASENAAAITNGGYARAVQSGELPGLLSGAAGTAAAVAVPVVSLAGDGWQPIQFDVLEDLAQDCFGPADLDRSPVSFTAPGEGRGTCPGCAGQVVEFPDGLKDTQDAICGPHRAEALRITTARLEAAKESNPPGWEALLDAGRRLGEPHLPNGLGPRLVAAASRAAPTVADLRSHAALVVGAAALMEGLPDPETGLGGRVAPVRPWLQGLPAALRAHGLDDEATEVAVAVGGLLANPSADQLAAAASTAAEEAQAKPKPYRRETRVGRNAPCPCGSGKKYKFCHGADR